MKRVSVIVPCYNVSAYLGRCVESLLKQTIGIENIEIILVDDASTDDGATWEIIMKYEEEFPDTIIAIPLEQNMRQGGARNVGISYASGEYLMFVDADDWLALEAMEHLYQKAKEHIADVVRFRMEDVEDNTDISLLSVNEGSGSHLLELYDKERRKAFLVNDNETSINNCTLKFYRTSIIKDNHIRFAEHLMFEEPAYVVPVLLYEKRQYFLDEVLYFCYISPESTTRGDWGKRKLDNLQVWMLLIDDLEQRGVLRQYYDEIEYLFFAWGYAYSILLLIRKGYSLTADEIKIFVKAILNLFPDICENPYLVKEIYIFRKLVREILTMEITEERLPVINAVLKGCLKV